MTPAQRQSGFYFSPPEPIGAERFWSNRALCLVIRARCPIFGRNPGARIACAESFFALVGPLSDQDDDFRRMGRLPDLFAPRSQPALKSERKAPATVGCWAVMSAFPDASTEPPEIESATAFPLMRKATAGVFCAESLDEIGAKNRLLDFCQDLQESTRFDAATLGLFAQPPSVYAQAGRLNDLASPPGAWWGDNEEGVAAAACALWLSHMEKHALSAFSIAQSCESSRADETAERQPRRL